MKNLNLVKKKEANKYFLRNKKHFEKNLIDEKIISLIKDNHLKALNGIKEITYRHKNSKKFFFEIEVEKLSEIEPALLLNPNILMFDNFSLKQIEKGIKIVNKRAKIEISGLKSEKELKKLSHLKIDFISMGDLTKNIKAIDFSLNVI